MTGEELLKFSILKTPDIIQAGLPSSPFCKLVKAPFKTSPFVNPKMALIGIKIENTDDKLIIASIEINLWPMQLSWNTSIKVVSIHAWNYWSTKFVNKQRQISIKQIMQNLMQHFKWLC
jgi:hypothetical protein